jgi:dihydropteroate synthase
MPDRPLVMGIVNVTPDSFSDGGCFTDPARAVRHGLDLVAAGADVLDVGGESTRPGASPVEAALEAERVIPVIQALAPHVRVSVDTSKPEVAEAAMAAGATLVNDVGATLASVAARGGAGWVAMHMQGEPRTMQHHPEYGDVVAEVTAFLRDRVDRARAAGVEEVWIDPGIGFGKTAEHNWTLLRALEAFTAMGASLVVGTSRKGFLGAVAADADGAADPAAVHDRLEGSVATAVHAAPVRPWCGCTTWRPPWPLPRGCRPSGVHRARR